MGRAVWSAGEQGWYGGDEELGYGPESEEPDAVQGSGYVGEMENFPRRVVVIRAAQRCMRCEARANQRIGVAASAKLGFSGAE